ncbi:type IV pilus twitching motility protein PilT [Nesterenkonia pannonica]|uniref:type IV pilus twitching motility protein PilT n=1 Tax=Nesterenkonia pannonica TaxID=1548602 RepID=UPI0021649AB8|nr:type IV pilus twitching motility protein PilT [Nesterenkonia pannonica]
MAEFSKLSKGLVLVTGPTGSGKSTTLAALIDRINRTRSEHIMTVEDPIEYLHPHKKSIVNQRQVGDDTESFQRALRQVLRQDPDVILIGEMRDLETIQVALTAAETGHLVFGTLHTQSAPQTIDRIIDVFPPHQQNQIRAQLASTLKGVVCQTLVPKIGGGRVAATEILVMTNAVANLVREGQMHQLPGVLQSGAAHGMHTYDQHFIKLVEAGAITVRDAEEKVADKESFRQRVQSVFRGRRDEQPPAAMPGSPSYSGYQGWNGQG